MAGEVSKLAERQAKLEGETKQIGQRVSNVEQDQRNLAGRMDDKFEILLSRVDNTLSELRQDNKDLSNRVDAALSEMRQNHKDLSNRMHKDFKWLIGAILGTGILLKIIDKIW